MDLLSFCLIFFFCLLVFGIGVTKIACLCSFYQRPCNVLLESVEAKLSDLDLLFCILDS